MKQFLLLFALATTLFSCSSDDNGTKSHTILQKVVFYPDSANEKHWNITNGLLTSITLADGSVDEEFTYDGYNRLIKDTKFNGGAFSELTTIAYNTDSTIRSINGLPYTYNAATKTYAYSYGSDFTINCLVNEDMLAVDFTRTGNNPGEYHMTYANGNMLSFHKAVPGSADVVKNFHFGSTVSQIGSVYSVILPIARVKSLTDPNFFIDCQVSKVAPDGFDNGSANPYHYNYGSVPSTDGKLLQVGVEVLDSNNNAISWYAYANYYYE